MPGCSNNLNLAKMNLRKIEKKYLLNGMVQANVGQKLMPINLIVRLNMYLTVMFRYFSTYNE